MRDKMKMIWLIMNPGQTECFMAEMIEKMIMILFGTKQ